MLGGPQGLLVNAGEEVGELLDRYVVKLLGYWGPEVKVKVNS